MTRRKRAGRPYQPLPERANRTLAVVIIIVALVLVIGITALGTGR